MPVKAFEVPKYAQIVAALEERISSGELPLGSMIPSEAALVAQFDVSRSIVVRALQILEQDGWVEARKGSGRFVLRNQAARSREGGTGRDTLGAEKAPKTRLVVVGLVAAPRRITGALGLEHLAPVWARRRLVTAARVGPVQLVTTYADPDLARGTDLESARPLSTDPVAVLAAAHGLRFDYATDRIGARRPDDWEADLLEVGVDEPVLTVLVTAFDNTGTARLVADAVIPPTRMELEDSFPLT